MDTTSTDTTASTTGSVPTAPVATTPAPFPDDDPRAVFARSVALATAVIDAVPAERLDAAWKKAIYPDHGWGGKNGTALHRILADLHLSPPRFLDNGRRHRAADIETVCTIR